MVLKNIMKHSKWSQMIFIGIIIFSSAIGQTISPTAIKEPLDYSKMSNEQWVKEMKSFYGMRFFYTKEELEILKSNVQLTDEQLDAFQKCFSAFAEGRLSQVPEYRKALGTKDIDVREWIIEGSYIFGTITLAWEDRQKKGLPDPESYSLEMIKGIKISDFYNKYVFQKSTSFKKRSDFDAFLSRHESEIKDRVVFEICGQFIQLGVSEDKTSIKALMSKRKKALQELLSL